MCSFTPYQSTSQSMDEMMDRFDSYKPGSRTLVNSYVQSTNSGTGQGKHIAVFEYDDGTVEYSGDKV